MGNHEYIIPTVGVMCSHITLTVRIMCQPNKSIFGPIESGPSEPKKRGLYGCSEKKQLLANFGPKIVAKILTYALGEH